MLDLRKKFWELMKEIASKDESVIVITGDLGYSFMEDYSRSFPKQYLNIGCIEQSMIGIAAGMALGGRKPYVYSGTIFALMRPYEQIRDDVAYNNLNVKIVGTGASGFLGFTHNLMGTENEFDLLKNLPNIKFRRSESEADLKKYLLEEGPSFIRI